MIRFDYTNVTAPAIGAEGLSLEELNRAIEHTSALCARILEDRKEGRLGFAALPGQAAVAAEIEKFADDRRSRFRNFVHIGIGGSALGAIALHTALKPRFYNQLGIKDRDFSPRIFFLDNIDPEETRELFELADPRETLFHIVTKSGETTETAAGFMIALERARKAVGEKWRDHFVATTGPRGVLRAWAEREKVKAFEIPEGVGGRFSVFSPVGLLPAAFMNISLSELLTGARRMDQVCFAAPPRDNPAFMLALVAGLLDTQRGKNTHVIMPYVRALRDVGDWFRQLWGESLGKKIEVEGKVRNVGPTPVLSMGATDQHSQLQLYTEGPNNKLILFLTTERYRHDEILPAAGEEEFAFLRGRKLADLIEAERKGTESSLCEAGRPNATLLLPEIEPKSIGELLFMLEIATVFAGYLYGVNTFDQPGVEAGKRATFALMGRPGFEAERARLEKRQSGGARLVVG